MPQFVEPVGDIFARRFFVNPDYRRGYEWEERQWDDLLQDLELLPPGRDHFTEILILQSVAEGNGVIQL